MKIAWNKNYNHTLPENHKFPMNKYDLLPNKLLKNNIVKESDFFYPKPLEINNLLRVHEIEYWEKLKQLNLTKKQERKMGFPQSKELIIRERTIMQGTLEAAILAFKEKFTFNIAGGTHHAFSDKAEGFCLLNDQAIAAQFLLDNNLAKRILICDLDVHQGNGTAQIFQNEPRVFTFSMHAQENYPLQKEKSDLDIGLHFKTTDDEYINLLKENLVNITNIFKPDFIFYQSGVDILSTDKFGRLNISPTGCKNRDEIVLNTAFENNIPLTASMGGGYSEDINIIVDAHFELFKIARNLLKR